MNLILRDTPNLENIYPGLERCLPAELSEAELEHIVIGLSQYTGAETRKLENYLSRKDPLTKQERLIIIPVWGMVAYRKEDRIEPSTGEVKQSVGVVFKARFNEEEGDIYISTEGVSSFRFFKKTLMMIRPIGNWERPLYLVARPVPLQVGATYSLSLVDAPL